MRLDNDSDELAAGRLFIRGRLNDPMRGPLYGRILAYDGDLVEYEQITAAQTARSAGGTLATADRGLHRGHVRRLVRRELAAPATGAGPCPGSAGAVEPHGRSGIDQPIPSAARPLKQQLGEVF